MAPDVIKTQAVSVDIARAEPLTAGATVADWLGVWERDPNVDVAVEVHAIRARDLITKRIADCVAGVAERGQPASRQRGELRQ